MTQFPKAKITNCSSPFHRARETAWCEAGQKNLLDCRSRASVPSLNLQLKTFNFYHVATFISKSPAETEAVGQQFAEDIGAGSTLALKGELGSGKRTSVNCLVAGLGTRCAVTIPRST